MQTPISSPIRLAMLLSHPTQYFVGVCQGLAKESSLALNVIYRTRAGVDSYFDSGFGRAVQWDLPMLDGYSSEFLSDDKEVGGFQGRVATTIARGKYDVLLVHGYNSVTNILAVIVARLVGTKVIMRGDTRFFGYHRGSKLKAYAKRMLFKLCDAFLTIGTLNERYYTYLGVPKCRMHFAPLGVCNRHFAIDSQARHAARAVTRSALGIEDSDLVILFASKLISRKGADVLLKAFEPLVDEIANARIVVAGSGPELGSLHTLANSHCANKVKFVGFQNQSQLPALYAASDVFVLPATEEPWGLVVNEAMAAGLPVIASSGVGAAIDLIEGKGTGVVCVDGDIHSLTEALRKLLLDRGLRESMGKAASALIAGWDEQMTVRLTAEAVEKVNAQ
jgi:glycosyltransferase involved in cell wall biosynthesis